MRLAEQKIKEAILHPDLALRSRAIRYFAKSYAADTSVMPLVIEAVEKHGREEAYHLVGAARELPQTEATIAWVIDELSDDRSNDYESYVYNLTEILTHADAALLLPKQSAILAARHFFPEYLSVIEVRLQMLAWDEATCWQAWQDHCETRDDNAGASGKFAIDYANSLVEALARFGDASQARVLDILSQEIDESTPDNPMFRFEELAVQLAGEARLQAAVPLLIAKLAADIDDVVNEKCAAALTRIGTPAVIEAIAAAYPTAPRHFRNYATGPLENIHSDLAAETSLALLSQETDWSVQCNLAYAALWQFAAEAIEPARNLLVGQELDFESRAVLTALIETCTLMDLRFPEYEQWFAKDKARQEAHQKQIAACQGDPLKLLQYAVAKLAGEQLPGIPASNRPKPKPVAHFPTAPAAFDRLLPRLPGKERHVGRNEPCPCGSGRKYKQCCLRKMES